MDFLLFSGSLRTDSFNKKLVKVANGLLLDSGNSNTKIVDLKTLNIPVYDGDIETAGIPDGVKSLAADIQKAKAIIISSPEYNGSIAGSLKNTIDWVSRIRPNPWEGKPVLLLGASPGYFGSIRALGVTRGPLETLGCFVYPQTFALPKAGEAFSPNGDLVDEGTKKRLASLLDSFSKFSNKLS